MKIESFKMGDWLFSSIGAEYMVIEIRKNEEYDLKVISRRGNSFLRKSNEFEKVLIGNKKIIREKKQ